MKYGGVTLTSQKVYYINLQEIKGIKFGNPNLLNYFDDFYNAELFLRTHGTYSMKITDSLLFLAEAIPRNREKVEVQDINEQYLSEFLEELQAAMNQMSVDGIRISVTTDDALGKISMEYADDFFGNGGFGVGNDYDGILFLIDTDNREVYIYPHMAWGLDI